jgi:hypothetical protein
MRGSAAVSSKITRLGPFEQSINGPYSASLLFGRQRKDDKRSDKQEMPRDPARRPPSAVRFIRQGLSVLCVILVRDLDAMDALRCAFEVGGYYCELQPLFSRPTGRGT